MCELDDSARPVVEQEVVMFPRAERALVILAVVVVVRRLVLAVPERSEHTGKAQILALEGHQHFVADLGNRYEAAILARHGRGQPRPITLARLVVPRVADLDAA